ncbi:MmgE/PrpD family protein [Roseomonas sp. SSH11]|uniref:MmgE/PrpD family protein n=1 Tax=Pararoseomonas baculiformis TaxID=2820812 RepID=A0ABS4AIX8_9PROT|nr:MmgE/PrpD family protein [Pararoseomonas baculiformis]MBP0446987.1 MmgE/PrpD family protein [Pararoseomonas baculiformis]
MSGEPVPRYAGEALGAFIAESRWEDITPALRHEARRSLLNFFGGALGVARDPAVETALRVIAPFSGPERVTVIGRPERLDAMGASFVNTIAANLLDYDDTHLETVIHPTAPVAPPLLALAELHGLGGAALLHAFILGAEVECRIGAAVSPGHYDRGWHITSTAGVFGAAAGCARLLGLDAGQCWHALGIAASQSAGLVENLPSAAKNVGMGNAARNGLLAALLAQAGYEAAPAAIEGPLGWARAMGDEPKLSRIIGGLGTHWEFARNTYKPYPAGIVFHAVIDACLELRDRVPPARIASILVEGDQLLLDRGDRPLRSERDCRVSIHHSAAVALLRGSAGVADFSGAALNDPAVAALRTKVTAGLDSNLPRGAARVTLRDSSGQTFAALVEYPRGSAARPLTDRELEAKFRDNAGLGGLQGQAEEWIGRIWALEQTESLGPLLRSMGDCSGR